MLMALMKAEDDSIAQIRATEDEVSRCEIIFPRKGIILSAETMFTTSLFLHHHWKQNLASNTVSLLQ
jgi:hypothetical protein